jgi:tetratricopeptide (TPR) repeat protein
VLIGLLEEALAALPAGDSALRARLLARLAAALQPAPDPEHPIALARDALAMVRGVADEPARREVLVAATSALLYFADPRERLPLDTELVELAERAGDRVAVLRGLLRLVFDHLELGDVVSADRTIAEYDRLSSAVALPMLRWRAPMLHAMRAVMEGRFDESEALCKEAAAIAEQVDDVGAKATLVVHAAGRLWAARRIDELAQHLPSALEAVGRMADPVFTRAFRVGMLARIGRAADARADFDALVRHDPPLRGRPMLVWAADACLALGDAAAAATLADLLTPLARRHYNWSPLAMVMEAPVASWIERLRALAGQASVAPPHAHPRFELTLEGDVWTIRADTTFRLPDSRGLRILEQLVSHPGREVHVTDLVAPPGESGHVEDAGDVLDAEAIAAYKRRLEDLREMEAEASSHDDAARAARAREEIEAIADELGRGVGLGGRSRKAASTAEKARVNVRQRLQGAITRIAQHSPALAKHLRQALRTGTFCCYDP